MLTSNQLDPRAVGAWRTARRTELLQQREALPAKLRDAVAPLIVALIRSHLAELCGRCLGLYWPFRAEIDVRAIAESGRHPQMKFALPVVAVKNAPLEFHRWRPGDPVTRGVWNIPIPAAAEVVRPDVLLVPLLGYDGAGYRLGYGGGYYDRTLAALQPRPYAIGIGLAAARLPTIRPQAHDIPMNVIITEDGINRTDHPDAHCYPSGGAGVIA